MDCEQPRYAAALTASALGVDLEQIAAPDGLLSDLEVVGLSALYDLTGAGMRGRTARGVALALSFYFRRLLNGEESPQPAWLICYATDDGRILSDAAPNLQEVGQRVAAHAALGTLVQVVSIHDLWFRASQRLEAARQAQAIGEPAGHA